MQIQFLANSTQNTGGGSGVGLLVVFVLLAAAAAAVCLLARQKTGGGAVNKSRDTRTPPASPQPKKAVSGGTVPPELIDAYCTAAQALEDWESSQVYAAVFVRAAHLLQNSLGLVHSRGKRDGRWLCGQLSGMFDNLSSRYPLTSKGFVVEHKPAVRVDTPDLRKKCQSLSPATLRAETAKLQRTLERKKADAIPFETILSLVGPMLWKLRGQAQSNDGAGAADTIKNMEQVLMRYGCVPHYYDDPAIASSESLRVQFITDSPDAVELPGLYVERDGRPALIGGCVGTRRGVRQ